MTIFRWLICSAFCSLLFTLPCLGNPPATITKQIGYLQSLFSADQTRQADLQAELKLSETILKQLSYQLANLNNQTEETKKELISIKKQQDIFASKLNGQKILLAQQIQTLYRLKNLQSLKTILTSDNTAELHRHLSYLVYLNDARTQFANEITALLSNLEKNLALIKAKETLLQKLLIEKKTQYKNQLQIKKIKIALLEKMRLQNTTSQIQVNSLIKQQAVSQKIQPVMPSVKTMPIKLFSSLQGRLTWPLIGKVYPSNKAPGVIIKPTTSDRSVRAVYAGKVIFSNYLKGFGMLIIITHDNGYMSLYARNQELYAKVNDQVMTHQLIGRLSEKEKAKINGLYFEIRKDGNPLSPLKWCR